MPIANNEIPFFGLYGEAIKQNDVDLIHIEEIEARSRDRDWVIKPHRHSKLFQLVYLEQGGMRVLLDEVEQNIECESLILIPIGVVHGFNFKPNSIGYVLSIQASALLNDVVQPDTDYFHPLTLTPQIFEFQNSDPQFAQFKLFINQLKFEFESIHVKRGDALGWLLQLTMLSVFRLQQRQKIFREADGESQLLWKFMSLLEVHYKDHWTVADYARNLYVSLSTLNRMCHKSLGEGAKILLQDRLLMEAKRRLEYTQQTSAEIAFALGFKDQAYFARFFKKIMKMTPGQFRSMKN